MDGETKKQRKNHFFFSFFFCGAYTSINITFLGGSRLAIVAKIDL